MQHHSPTAPRGEVPRDLSTSWEVLLPSDPSNTNYDILGPLISSSCWQPDSSVLQPATMPPSWRDEYLSSLREAEKNNPVNRDLVLACRLPRPASPRLKLSRGLTPAPLPSRLPAQRPHRRPRGREGRMAGVFAPDINTRHERYRSWRQGCGDGCRSRCRAAEARSRRGVARKRPARVEAAKGGGGAGPTALGEDDG